MNWATDYINELEKKHLNNIKNLCKDFYILGYYDALRSVLVGTPEEISESFEETWVKHTDRRT